MANVQVGILALSRSGFFGLRPDWCGISVESWPEAAEWFRTRQSLARLLVYMFYFGARLCLVPPFVRPPADIIFKSQFLPRIF
jgi:hypothetical protein